MGVSASYPTIVELVGEAQQQQGRRRLDLRFAYPDSHGLMAIFTMAKSNRDFLERIQQMALKYPDIHLADFLGEKGLEQRGTAAFEPFIRGGRR